MPEEYHDFDDAIFSPDAHETRQNNNIMDYTTQVIIKSDINEPSIIAFPEGTLVKHNLSGMVGIVCKLGCERRVLCLSEEGFQYDLYPYDPELWTRFHGSVTLETQSDE